MTHYTLDFYNLARHTVGFPREAPLLEAILIESGVNEEQLLTFYRTVYDDKDIPWTIQKALQGSREPNGQNQRTGHIPSSNLLVLWLTTETSERCADLIRALSKGFPPESMRALFPDKKTTPSMLEDRCAPYRSFLDVTLAEEMAPEYVEAVLQAGVLDPDVLSTLWRGSVPVEYVATALAS